MLFRGGTHIGFVGLYGEREFASLEEAKRIVKSEVEEGKTLKWVLWDVDRERNRWTLIEPGGTEETVFELEPASLGLFEPKEENHTRKNEKSRELND